MGRIWSDENRFRKWLAVEVAATETLAEAGHSSQIAAKAIRERANFKVERIHEIEAEVRTMSLPSLLQSRSSSVPNRAGFTMD